MSEMRKHLKDVLDDAERGAPTVITRYGSPCAAVVPVSWLEGEGD